MNNDNPHAIGEYISALSNSAALLGKAFAYAVWGVEEGSHEIVGTQFIPSAAKKGNEELENWLLHQLSPKIHFRFFELNVEGKRVVILEIERASGEPVKFGGDEFIRVGSYKKRLKEHAEKERALWRIFDQTPFEEGIAAERVIDDDVLRLLDYPGYFDLLKLPLPGDRAQLLLSMADDALISRCEGGGWNITNLGAVLFAKRLDDFRGVRRKAVRVVVYPGTSRTEGAKEHVDPKGYASGFEGLMTFVGGVLPTNEVIERALRKTVPMYPLPAVRELVANALIHQDFSVTGAGPMVEVFSNRMEITNPGEPLVETDRFLDSAPRSRNEAIASLTRRMGICEERGGGIDKVVSQTEVYQLPAPLFEVPQGSTRAVLFAHQPLTRMDRQDRIRACYLHACLKYVNREFLTNASVRERFGIEASNMAMASRFIREAVEAGAIAPVDQDAAPKLMKYVPSWAAGRRAGPGASP